MTLPQFVGSAADIASEAQALLRALRIPPLEIRGVGILVRRLDSARAVKGFAGCTSFESVKLRRV